MQITEKDLFELKEMITENRNQNNLVLEKIDSIDKRLERIEQSNDKITTAIIVTIVSVVIAGLIKWVLPTVATLT